MVPVKVPAMFFTGTMTLKFYKKKWSVIIIMKFNELKQLIKDTDNGVIRVQDSITNEYFMVDTVEIDVHGDLLIRIV